jgi:hypothetical protein
MNREAASADEAAGMEWGVEQSLNCHSISDRINKLDATQNNPGTTEILEALYRARDALDRAMVLLHRRPKTYDKD